MMPDMQTAPAWASYAVPTFNGQHDTHIETGEDYRTITLGEVFTMPPSDKAKGSSPAFIPSLYCDYDARNHAKQREQGQFVALTADIDKGNHAPGKVQKAVKAFVGDAAYLIYSSAHARPGDMRWRVILPLAEPCAFSAWYDAQTALYAFFASHGIECDYALARAAQPVYLPNVPQVHAKTETPLRDEHGAALFYKAAATSIAKPGLSLESGPVAEGIAAIRAKRAQDEREREQMRREAEQRRAAMPRGEGASIIDDFNASNSVATMLELCGYEQSPRNEEDWRSPHQTGETYATRVMGSKWFSLSESDVSAGVGHKCRAGCFGDAYDLFVHYKHGGDHKAAYRQLGEERRGHNVVPFPTPEPPEWMAEIPAYEAPPEWVDPDAEVVVDVPGVVAATDARVLNFEWAGKAEPVIDGFWLVEDWLPKSGIAAIYGHPGCGKSFFTIDIAAHVAAGVQWAGKDVEKGLVVYVIAEGQSGFRNRLYAMQQAGRIAPEAPFVFIPTPIDLQSPDGDAQALANTIAAAVDQAGMPPALVVIDTLSKTFGAGKENTDDMVSYVNNCQRIASEFDCLTLIVHHRPKDSESRDLRGHSSLRGNIDTAILIEAGQVKTATTIKQKDGEDNLHMRFTLERVTIGEDRKGKEVSTCLVSIVEGDAMPEQMSPEDRRRAKLTGHKKTALLAIEDVVAKQGREPPADIPPEAIDRYRTWKAVDADAVSNRLKGEFYALEDGDEEKRRDNARRNANRALKDLKSAGIIGTWGAWIWVN